MWHSPSEIDEANQRLDEALVTLDAMADASVVRAGQIKSRIDELRHRLREGVPLPQIVAEEPRPLIVELVTANLEDLQHVGSDLRRAEAEALRAHGLTIDRIAELFGVTRQRVSALLRRGERTGPGSRGLSGRVAG